MCNSIIITALIGPISGLIGTGIGYWLNYKNSIRTISIHEFIKAGNKFKESFVKTIEIIDESYLDTVSIIDMWNEVQGQKIALNEFIVHLPPNVRSKFRKAWKEYQCEDQDEFSVTYTVLDEQSQQNIMFEKRKLITDRINKLFHFTTPKFIMK